MPSRLVIGLIVCLILLRIPVDGKTNRESLSFDKIFLLISSGALEKAELELEKYGTSLPLTKNTETECLLLNGLLSFSKFEFDKSMAHLNEAEKQIGASGNPELNRARLDHFKGILFLKGFYKSEIAIDYFKEAERVYVQQNIPSYYQADIYFQLGRSYRDLGDIGNAKYFILKSLDIYEEYEQRYPIQIADNLNTLAVIELDLVHPQEGIDLFSNAVKEVQRYQKDHLLLSKIFDNLGFAFIMLSDEKRSVVSFRSSIAIAKKYSYGGFWASNSYLNLGEYYLTKNKIDSSIFYFKKCSQERRILFGNKHFENAQAFRHIAIAYRAKKKNDSSLYYLDKALIPYWPTEQDIDRSDDREKEDYLVTIDLISLRGQLLIDEYLADTLRKQSLFDAYSLFQRMDDLAKDWYKNFFWDNSNGYFHDVLKINYEKAIYTTYLLFKKYHDEQYANEALELIENNKAQILLRNLMVTRIISDSPNAQKMRERELSLKKRLTIAQLHKTLHQPDGEDQNRRKLVIALIDSLAMFYKTLEKSDLNYYASRFQKKFDLDENVKYLEQEKLSVLEFFYGADAIYSLVYNGKGVKDFQRVKRGKPLDLKFDSLLNLITHVPEIADQKRKAIEYAQLSHSVFHELLEKPLKGLTADQLIIIPDQLLFNLPFEALTRTPSKNETFSELDYLQKKYVISYAYSLASLLKGLERKSSRNSASAFGYSGTEEGMIKIGSSKEINAIAGILNLKIYLGENTTKQAVMESLQHDHTVHFALHGMASSEEGKSSVILPGADTLYAYEIYEIPVNASLVHLNACETMAGANNASEGVISLARAFLFSGARSVITNLWLLDDTQAHKLAIDFYTSIEAGFAPAEALTFAKRRAIEEGDQFTSHPYYWAGTILAGQPNNAEENQKWYPWLLLFLIFIIIVTSIIWKRNLNVQLSHKQS